MSLARQIVRRNFNPLASAGIILYNIYMTLEDARKTAAARRLQYYKARAQSRGLPFTLSYDDFFTLINSPCHYCGAAAEFGYRQNYLANQPFRSHGVDRVNNAEGYTPENTVACCFLCNESKSNHSLEEWLSWVQAVASRSTALNVPPRSSWTTMVDRVVAVARGRQKSNT